MRFTFCLASLLIGFVFTSALIGQDTPLVENVVFEEVDGFLAVEAEHFLSQEKTEVRAFHLVSSEHQPDLKPDGDPAHLPGASAGAYLEILPDTRRTHDDKLKKGKNFSNEPGKMAILNYKVHINSPGRYYIWVRAYSTGSEDNGLHVGLDGKWPEHGQRLQWCKGKHRWFCLLYTSPSPRDLSTSRMPSSA